MDADAHRRLRGRLRRPARPAGGDRQRVHDHRRLGADVEPGVRVAPPAPRGAPPGAPLRVRAEAGAPARLVHVASETIAKAVPDLGPGLLGDKAHSMVFDTSKLRGLVPEFTTTIPYSVGAERVIAWFDAHEEAQVVDRELDSRFDELIAGV